MKQNWTVIVAVVLAVVMLSAALILRPVRLAKEIEPLETSEIKTLPLTTETLPESEETEAQSEESTTEVKVYTPTTKRTEAVTVSSTAKYSSKVVSKLHEIAEKEKEWLSRKETKTESYSMTPSEFRRAGVIYYNGWKFTYYSEKVLPGKDLRIPGRHSDGNFVRDENNYICVACRDLPKGTVIDTPFGKGKVYDVCRDSGVVDIYVSWG